MKSDEAIAIAIGVRYFCGFNRRGAVQTSWSLAGATLFLRDRVDQIVGVTARLTKKNIKHKLVVVEEVDVID